MSATGTYTSFLVCLHPGHADVYREGLPLGVVRADGFTPHRRTLPDGREQLVTVDPEWVRSVQGVLARMVQPVAEAHGPAWMQQPTAPGWWWWWCEDQAPHGICVLIHQDMEEDVDNWWVYLPSRAKPSRLGTMPSGSLWHGPLAKPAMPNAEVSDGGPLTHDKPAAQSRRSLH
jgi:hypothetical protein